MQAFCCVLSLLPGVKSNLKKLFTSCRKFPREVRSLSPSRSKAANGLRLLHFYP